MSIFFFQNEFRIKEKSYYYKAHIQDIRITADLVHEELQELGVLTWSDGFVDYLSTEMNHFYYFSREIPGYTLD